jgi:hypothetical protein
MGAQANASLSIAATWVDNVHYFGPDRRRAFHSVVGKERRVANSASDVPSLWSALRKLRFHALDAYGQAGVAAFIARTKAVALLAEENQEVEIWEELTQLAFKLTVSPRGQDPRAEILRQLDSVCTRGSTAG